jgi:hypothetical protein
MEKMNWYLLREKCLRASNEALLRRVADEKWTPETYCSLVCRFNEFIQGKRTCTCPV